MKVRLNWMLKRELPEVFRIEEQVFPHPWEYEDFWRFMARRDAVAMTAQIRANGHDYIIGYMLYTLHQHHIVLESLAVESGEQRAGVGTEMMRHLLSKLKPSGRHTLITHVSEENVDACKFFASFGMQSKLVRGFWDTSHIDAVKFEATVNRRSPKWTELAV